MCLLKLGQRRFGDPSACERLLLQSLLARKRTVQPFYLVAQSLLGLFEVVCGAWSSETSAR